VHPSYRDGRALVSEAAHEAGRHCGARRRAERFDKKNVENRALLRILSRWRFRLKLGDRRW
jgi:hypothetical protein